MGRSETTQQKVGIVRSIMSDQTLNQNLLLADLNKSMEWGSASV